MHTCVVAVDIGGTKIATAFIDPADPTRVHARATRPTKAVEGGRTASSSSRWPE